MAGAPRSRPFLTPGASPFRQAVELHSATALIYIRSLPRSVPPLVVVALLAGGVLASGPVAIACLLTVMALFGWLLFLSWPALAPNARLVRVVVLAFMALGVALNLSR